MTVIDPSLPAGAMALTLAQLDFWEEFLFHPNEAVSTVAHAIEISGAVDEAALTRAIEATIAEADVLTVRFHRRQNTLPVQTCDPTRAPHLRKMDLSASSDPLAEAIALMTADINQPIDLCSEPLAAEWLVRLGPSRFLWFNRGHHIILDGYSMGLIEQRCAQLYAYFAYSENAGKPLAPFRAYLTEEEAYRQSARHAASGQFWAERAAEVGALPVIRKGEENYAVEGLEFEWDLSGIHSNIETMSQETGLGWADLMTILSAAYLLFRLPGTRKTTAEGAEILPIWLPYMSRMGSVSVSVPALVVNILPLSVSGLAQDTLAEFVTRSASGLRQLRRHGRYRIEQIAEDYGVASGSRFFFSPLINVVPFNQPNFRGCETHRHVLSNGPNDGFNVTIRAENDGSGMTVRLDADPALTPVSEFREHCRNLPAFLDRALSEGALGQKLGALLGEK